MPDASSTRQTRCEDRAATGESDGDVGAADVPAQGLDGRVWTRVRVNDRSYGSVILPAGSYWVGSSSGGHVLATSCLPGGVTPAS